MANDRYADVSEILKEKIPITTSNIFTDKNSLIILFQFSFGIFLLFAVNWWYFDFIITKHAWYFLLLLPFSLYGDLWLFTFGIASLSAAIIRILRLIHLPQEGIFELDSKEFKYYKMRYWSAYFSIWLVRAIPLPWVDFIVAKMLGSKIGRNVCLYDSWIDIELVDIGDHVMTSLNTSIMSHAVYQDKFIQLRTILEKNSISGAQSVIAPGTVLEEGAILGANCSTYIGQRLKGNVIHLGAPANKIIPIKIGDTHIPIQKSNKSKNPAVVDQSNNKEQ